MHADRLTGALALENGDLEQAIASLAKARDGFAGLEAAWEQAATELLLGRGARQRPGTSLAPTRPRSVRCPCTRGCARCARRPPRGSSWRPRLD